MGEAESGAEGPETLRSLQGIIPATFVVLDSLMDSDQAYRELMDALIDFKNGVSEQFAGVSAQFAAVYQRFDFVDAKLVEHDKRFEALEFHYGSLDRRVGRIETRLEDVERRLPA